MKRKALIGIVLLCLGCKGKHGVVSTVTHLVSVSQPGATLYLDRLDNRVVLQSADTAGESTFCSYLIGWKDSLLSTDAQKRMERERYFQYEMQQDWTAQVGGDSIHPVFFQEKPVPDEGLKEAAMVFEIPRGRRVDTLIYRDKFSTWGTQIFVLNGK